MLTSPISRANLVHQPHRPCGPRSSAAMQTWFISHADFHQCDQHMHTSSTCPHAHLVPWALLHGVASAHTVPPTPAAGQQQPRQSRGMYEEERGQGGGQCECSACMRPLAGVRMRHCGPWRAGPVQCVYAAPAGSAGQHSTWDNQPNHQQQSGGPLAAISSAQQLNMPEHWVSWT